MNAFADPSRPYKVTVPSDTAAREYRAEASAAYNDQPAGNPGDGVVAGGDSQAAGTTNSTPGSAALRTHSSSPAPSNAWKQSTSIV